VVKEDESYAELWFILDITFFFKNRIDKSSKLQFLRMGTHPSGPSRVAEDAILLSEWLKNKPSFVGRVPDSYPADDLPFLFKVLSVKTALSIQVT
jgi:mannose-6-phosphate isomerase